MASVVSTLAYVKRAELGDRAPGSPKTKEARNVRSIHNLLCRDRDFPNAFCGSLYHCLGVRNGLLDLGIREDGCCAPIRRIVIS